MITGMDEIQSQALFERVVATTIANQAALKCHLSGIPVTADNVIFFIGDFVDPTKPELQVLIFKIEAAIQEIMPISRNWFKPELLT